MIPVSFSSSVAKGSPPRTSEEGACCHHRHSIKSITNLQTKTTCLALSTTVELDCLSEEGEVKQYYAFSSMEPCTSLRQTIAVRPQILSSVRFFPPTPNEMLEDKQRPSNAYVYANLPACLQICVNLPPKESLFLLAIAKASPFLSLLFSSSMKVEKISNERIK